MITAAIATACLLVGYMLGLLGYAQASRHAYRRFIAAQGRACTPPPAGVFCADCRSEDAKHCVCDEGFDPVVRVSLASFPGGIYSPFESYRDADGFLRIEDMAPCDESAFYDYADVCGECCGRISSSGLCGCTDSGHMTPLPAGVSA